MAAAAFRNFCFALALASAIPSAPARAASPSRSLDQVRIHANYHDGEFDKVIKELEAFRKSGRACSPAESLFLEKHLAVVYAANPDTRELGRYHMFRLLDMAPGSDLLDMFVGQEVDAVFEKARKEHVLRPAPGKLPAARLARAVPSVSPPASAPPALAPHPVPPPSPARPARPPSVRKEGPAPVRDQGPAEAPASSPAWKEPGLWIGGGAALAVVAFTFFYSGGEAAPAGKTYVVPATASP